MRLILSLLYLAVLGAFGFLFLIIGRYVVGDIQQFSQTLSVQGAWRMPSWLEGSSFHQTLIVWLPAPDKLMEAIVGEQRQFVLPAVLNFTENIGSFVNGVFLILLLSIYWSVNQVHFERLWLSLLPSEQRKHARGIWRTIELDLGSYVRSEIAQSLFAGLMLGLGYWFLGSPYPIFLAMIGALAWLIPVVGAPLAIVAPLLIGSMTSIQLGLFAALYTLIILIALQVWIEPRLYKRKWDNPILTLIILLAMADAFGLPGILIAPPLSAMCQIVWNLLVSNRQVSGAAVQVFDLKDRHEHLLTVIKEMDEPPPPLVASSMERLINLIEKAESILPAVLPVEKNDSFPLLP
jgi:predicted PurR-regulated permease PerM